MRLQQEIVTGTKPGEASARLATRMKREVLDPWRQAARPLTQGPELPGDSPQSKVQRAVREYLRVKDRAMVLTMLALQDGEPQSIENANLAWARVKPAFEQLRQIRISGT
jgi:hypothetical protein